MSNQAKATISGFERVRLMKETTDENDYYTSIKWGWTAATRANVLAMASGSAVPVTIVESGNFPLLQAYIVVDAGVLKWAYYADFAGQFDFITVDHTEADVWHTVQLKTVAGVGLFAKIDGDDYGMIYANAATPQAHRLEMGQGGGLDDGEYFVAEARIGTTAYGSSDLFSDDFASFAAWNIATGDPPSTLTLETDEFPGEPPPPTDLGPCQSPMWRFVVTDGDTNVVTILDRVASDREVHPLLDVPNYLSYTVPSDSPLVNIPYPTVDDDPFVAEGDRLTYAFRQEHNTAPYFVCRAAGVNLQVEDAAQQDDARTRVTAWDPWKLAAFRPAQNADGELPSQIDPLPAGYWDGKYLTGTTAGEIVLDQLLNTITNNGLLRVDAGVAYGGTAFYAGTIEATIPLIADADGVVFVVQQGMSVADVWSAMVNTLTLDIVLTPIFDPDDRPGYTHELNIYVQAGVEQPDDIFGWDRPPHSLVALSRMIDGTQRANNVFFAAGQGGVAGKMAAPAVDAASVTKYGEYWAQQYLPGSVILEAVEDMAAFQLSLRKNGRTTIQFSPTPERSPCPFVEYNLGDRVPVYASADGFRQVLLGFVRIYGFPIAISDDALEAVQGMILLPELA